MLSISARVAKGTSKKGWGLISPCGLNAFDLDFLYVRGNGSFLKLSKKTPLPQGLFLKIRHFIILYGTDEQYLKSIKNLSIGYYHSLLWITTKDDLYLDSVAINVATALPIINQEQDENKNRTVMLEYL